MTASRREFLKLGLASAFTSAVPLFARAADDLPAPKYTLAMNLEIMFPGGMPYEERLERAAKCGATAYGIWSYTNKNIDALLKVQAKHKMACASISGNPLTGWSTGLTQTGKEAEFLADFEKTCKIAKRLGAPNLITFVGAKQKDIPWDVQEAQIVAGLKKAGPIAESYDVFLTLEPLNRVESPQMTMLTVGDAYRYAAGANHPRIKVDFDIYHRALGEGNILNTLAEGLKKGFVSFVEVGDVPGRKEPGSGETNYRNIFNFLRRQGYAGYIGMEHGTTSTPQEAWDRVKELAGL